MAMTSAEKMAALRARRKSQGLKPYTVWVTKKEKAVIEPIVKDKLKELREKDNKK